MESISWLSDSKENLKFFKKLVNKDKEFFIKTNSTKLIAPIQSKQMKSHYFKYRDSRGLHSLLLLVQMLFLSCLYLCCFAVSPVKIFQVSKPYDTLKAERKIHVVSKITDNVPQSYLTETYIPSRTDLCELFNFNESKRSLTVLPCLALPCLALPCLALPCLALPCLALPCLALPCLL